MLRGKGVGEEKMSVIIGASLPTISFVSSVLCYFRLNNFFLCVCQIKLISQSPWINNANKIVCEMTSWSCKRFRDRDNKMKNKVVWGVDVGKKCQGLAVRWVIFRWDVLYYICFYVKCLTCGKLIDDICVNYSAIYQFGQCYRCEEVCLIEP